MDFLKTMPSNPAFRKNYSGSQKACLFYFTVFLFLQQTSIPADSLQTPRFSSASSLFLAVWPTFYE
jgi:hypothetical protein